MEYPWYKILGPAEDLQQGDFILNCEITIPPRALEPGDEIEVEAKLMDAIILSQSCDLINKHVEIIPSYSELSSYS